MWQACSAVLINFLSCINVWVDTLYSTSVKIMSWVLGFCCYDKKDGINNLKGGQTDFDPWLPLGCPSVWQWVCCEERAVAEHSGESKAVHLEVDGKRGERQMGQSLRINFLEKIIFHEIVTYQVPLLFPACKPIHVPLHDLFHLTDLAASLGKAVAPPCRDSVVPSPGTQKSHQWGPNFWSPSHWGTLGLW